jgi:hypothetical protein
MTGAYSALARRSERVVLPTAAGSDSIWPGESVEEWWRRIPARFPRPAFPVTIPSTGRSSPPLPWLGEILTDVRE